jgi:hypothetical protein
MFRFRKTVASITKSLVKITEELDDHVNRQANRVGALGNEIAVLRDRRIEHLEEMNDAEIINSNLKRLLGD